MMELKKYKLDDVASIIVGYPFESERFNTEGNGVRLVRGMNVSERFLRFGEETRWWDDLSDKLRPYYLQEDDILIGMDGSKVGKNFAIVKKEDLPLLLVQRVACIRAKNGFDQRFIWQYVSSPRFIEYVKTIKTGSSIPHISGSQISNFPIFAPSYDVQKKIGSLLSSLDSKISLNRKMNRTLEDMAKQLYDYWFVQFDFPDENGKPYKSSGGKMVWNEVLKREIPEGWEVKKIGEILGKVKNTPRLVTDEYLQEGKYPIIDQTRDVYYAGFTNREDAVSTQFPAVVFGDHSCAVKYVNFPFVRGADGTQVMLPNDTRLSVEYLYFFVQNVKISEGYARHYSFLKESPIILPKQEIADLFKNAVSKWFKMITHNRIEITALTRQRDELLPLLMNGQVEVGTD